MKYRILYTYHYGITRQPVRDGKARAELNMLNCRAEDDNISDIFETKNINDAYRYLEFLINDSSSSYI